MAPLQKCETLVTSYKYPLPPCVQVDQEQGLLALEQAVALREESVSVNVVKMWGSVADALLGN